MRKKYLEPRMRVQIFDEETVTNEEVGDDTNVLSTFGEDDDDGFVIPGDDL